MTEPDDARRVRAGLDALANDLTRAGRPPPGGAPSLLARTVSLGAYPAAARAFYACTPLSLLGTEAEGSAGVTADAGSRFFALNLGGAVPPAGTQILATLAGSRWVFRYDG